jgi:hypothetical protein
VHPKQQASRRALRWKRKRIAVAGYSSEVKTAEELGVAVRTLRAWRQRGMGPPWAKVGRQVIYGDESRMTWLRGQEVQPVRQAEAHD